MLSPAQKQARDFWTFKRAALVLLLMTPWASLMGWLIHEASQGQDGLRIGFLAGVFFAALPVTATVAFRPWLVFEFFRSVRVGVVNLILIGLGSILGVMFFQEDKDFPLPEGAVESLVEWVDNGEQTPWTQDQFRAYHMYANLAPQSGQGAFRNAQAFFVYRFLEGLKLDGLLGLPEEVDFDRKSIDENLARLDSQLPAVEARFGEEFTIALRSQSETGLVTQQRNQRIEALEEKYDDFWWTLFVWSDRLDLIRVYQSNWFGMYWLILAGGVIVNTFRGGWKRNLRPSRWGFVATHAGVLMIVFGGIQSSLYEQRGILELNIGKTKDQWETWGGQTRGFHGDWTGRSENPFAMRLSGFRADHHDVLSVNFLTTKADGSQNFEFDLGRQPAERLWDGKKLEYDRVRKPDGSLGDPQLVIEVLDKIDHSAPDPTLLPAGPDEFGHPLARVALIDEHGHRTRETPLAAALQNSFVHARSGSRVRLAAVASEQEARERLTDTIEENWGFLRRDSADSEHKFHQIMPGVKFTEEMPEGNYEVEVLDAQPFLQIASVKDGEIIPAPVEHELAYLEPRNPAVLLRIEGPSGYVEERWVLAADTTNQLPVKFKELRYGFLWDEWASPVHHRYLLMLLPDGSLLWGEHGDPASLRPVTEGDRVALGLPESQFEGAELEQLEITQAELRASLSQKYQQKAGVDFFDDSPGAVHLAITKPGPEGPQTEELWLRTREGPDRHWVRYRTVDGGERELVLLFTEDTSQVVEWQSRLTVLEENPETGAWEDAKHAMVRVNDYFHYKGYRFFQTNHNPRDPTYSGIGVVYDPGIPYVLTGYYLVMFGTAVVFLLKPLLTRRHRTISA